MIESAGTPLRRRTLPVAFLAVVVAVAELQALSLLYDYQTGLKPACFEVLGQAACTFIGFAVPRALGVVAALALFAIARPTAVRRLLSEPGRVSIGLPLNLGGFALLALPGLLLSDDALGAVFVPLALAWLVGAALAGAGVMLMLARLGTWRRLLVENGLVLGLLIGLGGLTPELATLLYPLWQVEAIADVTFLAVVRLLELAGYAVEADPAAKIIGARDFAVQVSSACSGVEGFALITVFLTIYLVLFRREIAFPAALLLYPIGIAASWGFNVLRIAILLVIGVEGAPELAVGGFHSRAGWLAFTVLAFVLIFVARNLPAFRRIEGERLTGALTPLRLDPAAAALVPFAVFMLSAHVVATISETPGALYPWRALAMAAAVAVFWPVYRALPWRLDALAVGSGLAIGVLWAATAPPAEGPPPFGALTGAALGVWMLARVIGTGLLVPLIEEVLFRGYLLERLAPSGRGWRMALAIAASAGLFAVLHDRWLAAFLSGLVFGALVARSGRVADAIVAHAAANLTIAAWAFGTGDWHVI